MARAVVAAIAMMAAGCRTSGPAPAIDPALADLVPADATAVAGLDLEALRASPLYGRLPAVQREFLETFHEARYALAALRGDQILIVGRGTIPGGTAAGSGVSVSGAPDMIRDATARHTRSPLVGIAEPLAVRNPVWAVVRGGMALPLTGNLANANNLLRGVDRVTLAAQLADRVSLELTAACPSAELAARFEGSLRALVSLAEAASARQPEIAAMLRAVQVQREDRSVHAALAVPPEALGRLLP